MLQSPRSTLEILVTKESMFYTIAHMGHNSMIIIFILLISSSSKESFDFLLLYYKKELYDYLKNK